MPQACRYCRAPIEWARTSAGKAMPLDAEPNPDGNILVTTENGVLHATILGPADPLFLPDGAERRMPHFATCPNYDPTNRSPA